VNGLSKLLVDQLEVHVMMCQNFYNFCVQKSNSVEPNNVLLAKQQCLMTKIAVVTKKIQQASATHTNISMSLAVVRKFMWLLQR